jgi:hypothetical protein
MWFPAMPVLGSSDGVALPVPDEPGFQLSWMTERRDGHTARWAAPQPVASPAGSALPYGPQRLLEGWLRFNPSVLEFALVDKATGRPEVTAGAAAPLLLTLTNRKPGLVTFAAGSIAGEGMAASGSIFFIHFGRLLKAEDVGALQFAADGWTFQPMTDARYGPYWAAARTRDALKLFPGESRTIEVRGLAAAAGVVQGQVLFDYYNVAGASDGVYAEMMAVLGSRPSG